MKNINMIKNQVNWAKNSLGTNVPSEWNNTNKVIETRIKRLILRHKKEVLNYGY